MTISRSYFAKVLGEGLVQETTRESVPPTPETFCRLSANLRIWQQSLIKHKRENLNT